eukprot:2422874-Rhodomonas_salina.1
MAKVASRLLRGVGSREGPRRSRVTGHGSRVTGRGRVQNARFRVLTRPSLCTPTNNSNSFSRAAGVGDWELRIPRALKL